MKKTRLALTIAFLFTIFMLFAVFHPFATVPPEKTLLESFKDSGAKTVSSEIYFRGKAEGRNCSIVGLVETVSELFKALGCTEYEMRKREGSNLLQGIEADGRVGTGRLVNLRIRKEKLGENRERVYLTVSVTELAPEPPLDEIRRNVLPVFEKCSMKAEVNACITGSYAGKLPRSRLNEIFRKVFKKAEAQKVEGMDERNMISVSAYTPVIGEWVRVNGSRVNLNLAARYNSFEDRTYLWLATPVITTEY